MRPQQNDLDLIGCAVRALRKGLGPHQHPTATAVRTSVGSVHLALGLGDGCPEPGAVGAAQARGERVTTLVTVRHVDADTTRVISPCRPCQQLLARHAPALRVVHLADGLRVTNITDVPHLTTPYVR